jgi:hypothetical protein
LSSSTPGTLFQCQWHNKNNGLKKKGGGGECDHYTHFLHIKKCCAKTDEANYDTSDIE